MRPTSLLNCLPSIRVDFVRGENCSLWDEQGSRYLDLESGSWSAVLGHNHPRINAALRAQADRIMHLNVRYPNHLAEEAATRVLAHAGLEGGKCVFLSSGSEAVEFGVQTVRRITGKPLLLSFANSYLAAFGSAGQKRPDEWHLFDGGDLGEAEMREALDRIPFERIGGFVLETGGGSPDFLRFPPVSVVNEIARRVKASGGFLVLNEITTGLGRTGEWFGFHHYGIRPDIIALGKGLGNGYPVSAVALEAGIADRFEASGTKYAQSHQNNPLGCAVALEVMAELEEGGWIARGRHLGAQLLERLQRLPDPFGRIKAVRGRGMLLALEFDPNRGLTGDNAHRFLWERKVITSCYPAGHPAGTGLRMDPALTVPDSDLDFLLACLEELLAR